ncbi:MAG: methyltransferase domain-containing protein [Candidatus Nanoarchaeia archaeon]|nr:methyltransferase domain-containing protein [Candidatus Nanoarchaeia archaeon]
MERLNIGCGYEKKEGFINIDISKKVKPDMVVNIEKGLPFKDNTFDYIYSWNVLEEIRPQFWDFVLREISRIAKDGCILELSLAFDNLYNRGRINHYRVFNWDSFLICEEGQEHNYTAPIILRNLKKKPNRLTKLWFSLFPFLKQQVRFKFRIIKKDGK